MWETMFAAMTGVDTAAPRSQRIAIPSGHRGKPGNPGWRRRALPFAVGGILALSTVGAALALENARRDRDGERFRREVQATQDRIVNRIDTYVNMLLAARALLSVVDPADSATLRRWIGSLDLQHRYPGVKGIGFVQVVAAGDRLRMTDEMRRRGESAYHIWPGDAKDPACAVTFVDPRPANPAGLGFDMCSESVRRAAIVQARDSGMPTASDWVMPILPTTDHAAGGFLVFVPVYGSGAVPASVDERRRDVLGYLFTRFRTQALLQGILGADQHPSLSFSVDDPDGPVVGRPLFESGTGEDDAGHIPRLAMTLTVPVAGRNWEMSFRSRPAFDALSAREVPVELLLAGLGISIAAALVVRAQQRARLLAENAEAWTRFLSDTTEQLGASLDSVTLAQAVARFSVPMLGDWCTIDLLDSDDADGKVRRAILAHADPARADLADKLRAYSPRGKKSPLIRQALSEGRGIRRDVTDEMMAATAQDEQHLALLKQMGVRSVIVVPLIARERVLGWMWVTRVPAYRAEDLAMMEDLGRRAAMALDNARLYAQAQEGVRLRDAFVSIASHELKGPLTTLRLQAQGLLRAIDRGGPEATDLARTAQRATVIEQQTGRLAKLIDDLMDVSRISAGRLSFDVQDVDLGEVVQEVVGRIEDERGHSGSAVEVHLPGTIVGRWDRSRLDQVLTNLLSNAIKYGAQRPVSLRVESLQGLARVSVRDEGIGIAPENQGRIFQRFERLVSDRHYGGFGLGLWITREIVEAQGGRVMVESMPGQGSTFVVELPTGR